MTEIVAELSGNHGGSLQNAHRLIDAAKASGADAVKFQCFSPERQAIKRNRPDVLAIVDAHHGGEPLLDLYYRVWTPWTWFPALIAHCKDIGIPWFSSVFAPEDVEYMESLSCPRYKISAWEIGALDWQLIKAVKETGKPVVMSVRQAPGVIILDATDYNGEFVTLGLSAHGAILPHVDAPMVEYHLKLDGVETPDSKFSLTPAEFARMATLMGRIV